MPENRIVITVRLLNSVMKKTIKQYLMVLFCFILRLRHPGLLEDQDQPVDLDQGPYELP